MPISFKGARRERERGREGRKESGKGLERLGLC